MDGWIKLHRKLLDWEWYDDTNVVRLFLHLLLTVNYEPKKWHGIVIDRGQLVTSADTLAKALGLTARQIRYALEKLQNTREIVTQTSNKYTLITICKFAEYQVNYDDNCKQNVKQMSNECNSNVNQMSTTKEIKNIRNKEYNIIESTENAIFDADKSATQKQPTKTIDERRNDFMYKIADVGKGVYPDNMLRAFFDYWSESNENGRKMLFEMKKTFDIKKRLAKWAEKENNFKSKNYGDSRNNPNSPDYVTTERIVAAGLAMAKTNN